MNTIAIVFNAEFTRRIRSRAFFASIVIGAAGILAMTVLPLIMTGMVSNSTKKIVLVGPPTLTAQAKKALAHDFEVSAVLTNLEGKPTAAFLDAHGKASAVAILSTRPGGLRVTAYTREPSLFRETVGRDLATLQIATALGVPPDRVVASSKLSMDVHDVSGRFANADAADAAKGVGFLFVILLYLSILLNAQAIMTSVAEEKTNRIAELLVATIDPARLLTAKILAAAATSIVQLGAWMATGIIAGRVTAPLFTRSTITGSSSAAIFGSVDVSSGEILAFLAFFAVGFAQYGVLYAAAASLINRTEDIGTVAGPLVIPVVIAFFLAIVGMQTPNSPSIVIFSMIPLVSPFVMFTRVAVSNVPAWQIVVSLALNVGAAVLLAWISGKIYRVGLLLYGRPPSLRQIIATLRA